MNKQEYMLIALDMDGTLLNSRQEITPRARRAIEEILRQGKQVVFSTGRCIGEMEAYLDAFPSMQYLVCESGACVYDLRKKEHIARIPLPPGQVLEVMECVEGEVPTPFGAIHIRKERGKELPELSYPEEISLINRK